MAVDDLKNLNNKTVFFRKQLLDWYKIHKRPLPWRKTADPYTIWLSEVVLQQTQIKQGLPYFKRLLANFPTVDRLAAAEEDLLLALWEGLGYYTRARQLHRAAKQIVARHNGQFPNTYAELIQLPGIGPYTAAALCSFSFNIPKAVLDGNVFRVLARYWGIDRPINISKNRRYFQQVATHMLPHAAHSPYNQGIMDFGATQCTPHRPACPLCPLRTRCAAYQTDQVQRLPQKVAPAKKRVRFFDYYILRTPKGGIYLKKRAQKDIWKGLHEFYLIEHPAQAPPTTDAFIESIQAGGGRLDPLPVPNTHKPIKHTLSHQHLLIRFFLVTLPTDGLAAIERQCQLAGLRKFSDEQLASAAMPIILRRYALFWKIKTDSANP